MADTQPSAPGTFRAAAHAVLFGFPPAPIEATIRPRSSAWRMSGAARKMGIALVVAPVVGVVPPHAPWVIGALVTGAILARRRWTEHFTVVDVVGVCPKCGKGFDLKSGRLRKPHALPCEECHHNSTLKIPDGVLESAAEKV